MKSAPKPLTQAVALALGALALAPVPASALTVVYSTTTTYAGTASVTDVCGSLNATSCDNASTSLADPVTLGSATLTQFDPNLGVLMGTSLSLESTRTQTLSGSLSNGDKNKTSTTAIGQSNGEFSAPGASTSFATISATGTAQVPNTSGATTASFGPSTATSSTNTTSPLWVASGSLNSYVTGAPTTTATLKTSTVMEVDSTWTNGNKNNTTSTATYKLDWSGTVTTTYDYLLHAAPSFNGSSAVFTLNLNLGTVNQNSVATQQFSLFNLANPDRVGLDLDSFSETSDPDNKFSTNLAVFSGLSQGQHQIFTATLDTSTLGAFTASYLLSLSDADVGAAASRFVYTLNLNLSGTVQAASGVPEPATLGLLGLGLTGLVVARRRKRQA